VRTKVVPNVRRATLSPEVRQHVKGGSEVFTDALASYADLGQDFVHQVIDHAESYAEGKVHTNGLENFWSLLKRSIKGTYVAVEPFHLFRYLDEQSFRFNNRKVTDGMRFLRAAVGIIGKRVTYKELIGGEEATPPPTPFDRFAEFTRKIVSVPKEEVDEQARRFREEHPPRGKRRPREA
jgi:transposase-like protein